MVQFFTHSVRVISFIVTFPASTTADNYERNVQQQRRGFYQFGHTDFHRGISRPQ